MRMMGNGLTVTGALLLVFLVWPAVGQASTTGAQSQRKRIFSSLELLSTRTLGFRSLPATRGHVIECVCAESRCEIPDEVKEELRVDENGTWRVTEELYKEHGIQQIIDCAEEGDVISLDASLTIRPPSRIVARRNVTILGGRRLDGGLLTKRTIFNCPPGEGLFLLKCVSTVVLLVNAVCTAEAASRWSTLSSRTATWLSSTESWPSLKWTPAASHPSRIAKCVFPTCCSKTTRISADLSVWLCAIRPVAALSNCATSPSRATSTPKHRCWRGRTRWSTFRLLPIEKSLTNTIGKLISFTFRTNPCRP